MQERLPGVDGLRALAALWVVAFHMRAFSGAHLTGAPGFDMLIRSGSTGVSLFLVLSGFCLYTPYAAGRQGRFSTMHFLARRCGRLLPAYYASLCVTLLVIAVAAGPLGLLRLDAAGVVWQAVAHGTMIHTFFTGTFYAVNGAYWSLGLEWQLYLALPLLIVGVRRMGLPRTIALAVAVNVVYRLALDVASRQGWVGGALATDVLPNQLPGRWAEFALGMVAAELYATGSVGRWAVPARRLGLAIVPVALLTSGGALSHLLFGTVFFTLLLVVLDGRSRPSRVLSWRPLAFLGTMSYSLYLVHQPIVEAVANVLRGHGASPSTTFLIEVVSFPAVLAVAWVLFALVERRTVGESARGAQRRRSRYQSSTRPFRTA
jgi:peptidoglycan/LPS O-acetylase OafA/YrhL